MLHKTSKSYCTQCYYCHEPNAPHWACDYYLKTKQRRGCAVGECDKFVSKQEGSKKYRIGFGKGKGFNYSLNLKSEKNTGECVKTGEDIN